MADLDPRIQRLVDAGFTEAEVRAVAADLKYLAALARAGEVGARADIGGVHVDWTPEKGAALAAFLREMEEQQ